MDQKRIKKQLGTYFEMNENEKTYFKNIGDGTKPVIRGKHICKSLH